jgi:hypothetical protein
MSGRRSKWDVKETKKNVDDVIDEEALRAAQVFFFNFKSKRKQQKESLNKLHNLQLQFLNLKYQQWVMSKKLKSTSLQTDLF